MTLELRPQALVADYTGQPGERTFFLQARSTSGTYTYLLEKQQVQLLGEKLRELLLLVDARDPVVQEPAQRDPELRLEAPIEPEWRIGTMGLGYDDDRETIVLSMHPVTEQELEEGAEEPELSPEEFAVRMFLSRDQARGFVAHALAVVAEGRPLCQLCGLPMDPEGHACPASNGHRLG